MTRNAARGGLGHVTEDPDATVLVPGRSTALDRRTVTGHVQKTDAKDENPGKKEGLWRDVGLPKDAGGQGSVGGLEADLVTERDLAIGEDHEADPGIGGDQEAGPEGGTGVDIGAIAQSTPLGKENLQQRKGMLVLFSACSYPLVSKLESWKNSSQSLVK